MFPVDKLFTQFMQAWILDKVVAMNVEEGAVKKVEELLKKKL